jgi:hypothetical protein
MSTIRTSMKEVMKSVTKTVRLGIDQLKSKDKKTNVDIDYHFHIYKIYYINYLTNITFISFEAW